MKQSIIDRYEKTIRACICKMRNAKILLKSEINMIANENEIIALSAQLKSLRNEYNYIRFEL